MSHHGVMSTAAPSITYENVGKTFTQDRTGSVAKAVDDVSLSV
ncbi:hypothetical protein BH10PSE10_BH10PSE10_03370 [soil metagenome]